MVYDVREKFRRRRKLARDHKIRALRNYTNSGANIITPEFFVVSEEPKKFFDFLNNFVRLDKERDVYLDVNHATFCSPYKEHGIFYLYSKCLAFAFAPVYKEKFEMLRRKMIEIGEGLARVVEGDNVLISEGVKNEINDYMGYITRRLDSFNYVGLFREQVIEPVERIYKISEKANLRLEGREEDPLIERIIPEIIDVKERKWTKPLSRVDKQLIALVLVNSLTDGRKKLILSYDKGIAHSVRDLYENVIGGNRAIRIKGLTDSLQNFERVDIGVGKIHTKTLDGHMVLDVEEYEDFFGKERFESYLLVQ